jgi:hypothetical protein
MDSSVKCEDALESHLDVVEDGIEGGGGGTGKKVAGEGRWGRGAAEFI